MSQAAMRSTKIIVESMANLKDRDDCFDDRFRHS